MMRSTRAWRGGGACDRASPVIDIRNLTVALPSGADRPFAIEDVSFSLLPQEVLCIVGESGSGKSLTSQAIMGLLPGPEVHIASGSILFEGRDLAEARTIAICRRCAACASR